MSISATGAASHSGLSIGKVIAGRGGVLLVLVLLVVGMSILSPYFLTSANITNILRQSSINGMLALGMTFVILTKGIDLSVGSTLALAGVVAGSLATAADPYPIAIVVMAGLGVGAIAGLVNGTLVSYLSVPPFVVTLGMLSAARGVALIYTDGVVISNLSQGFRQLGTAFVMGVPVPVIFFALVFAICFIVLRYTPYGRHIYAVGGNERAARNSGIRYKRVKLSVYVICGTLAGLAGIVLTARTTSALPQAGAGYELDAIAAVVIGGASLSGGKGSIVGTLIGVLIIGTLNNGLDLLGVSSYYQQVVKGALIVAAVLLDYAKSDDS